jgi:phenylalanyl-tRNA synthetase alpha chain
VYRRDTPSPRSTPNFHQVEALAVDRNITLADLKGTLLHFFHEMFGGDREVRMRTSFFPFTEPSVEFDVTCFLCGGAGCVFCKYTGWFEMGGAGVVDPAVFQNVGLDPTEWSGFAWGLGIDRIAAQRHGVPDIRMFWENDLRALRQF